jgi:hypothetical protein
MQRPMGETGHHTASALGHRRVSRLAA